MRFLDALQSKNQGTPPVWLMRQAGRYLPQYRALKGERNLYELFHDVEAIVEVTKLPIDLLDFDAAILFSDILTVFEGLNLRYDFRPGPIILDDPSRLQVVPTDYAHITQSIQLLKRELKVPLIGFAGGPYTIASYLMKNAKQSLYRDPIHFENVIDQITEATITYLNIQVAAGVDAIQIFDSWASQLGIHEFRSYCLKPMEKIVAAIDKPVILFCRNSSFFAEELAKASPAAISLDWSGDLASIRKKISLPLQGNLDPMALYAPREILRKILDRTVEGIRGDPGYIFNLGHGVLPDTPVENVQFLVDYVRTL